MASWSMRRQLIYGGSVLIALTLIGVGIFFRLIYTAPSCTDGVQNGDEQGIDCGGSCQILCSNDTLTPIVLWAKAFNVSGTLYNVGAYVQNPNVNSKNTRASYEFRIYDDKNILIDSRDGETFIPRNKTFLVFEPGFNITFKKPKRVEFEFTSLAPWQKDSAEDPPLSISYDPLTATSTAPQINGTITNNSFNKIGEIELSAIVLDSKQNAVAVSRTLVDNLDKQSSQQFVFTWPKPFDLGVESCVSPVDMAVVLDRSGSMQLESTTPPEPLNTVKATAKNFINALRDDDQVSIISFGTHPTLDSMLSLSKKDISSVVDTLAIGTSSDQGTNIGGGLTLAQNELTSSRARPGSKKVIVLLTDGVPTEPTDSSLLDYPKQFAQQSADSIKNQNITMYSIGLGSGVDGGFLKNLVGDSSRYFYAPTKNTLSSIYQSISSSLCIKKPNVITIIYRIL